MVLPAEDIFSDDSGPETARRIRLRPKSSFPRKPRLMFNVDSEGLSRLRFETFRNLEQFAIRTRATNIVIHISA